MLANTRVAWFNGAIVPEGQVLIPYRDRSWKSGDGAFDMTRTFNGVPFRLQEHIERFYKSLRYVRIDPPISPKEMVAVTEEVVARNEHLRAPHGDWWVCQRVSRGVDAVGDEGWEHTGPNLVVDVTPLPLASRAAMYRDGAEVMTTTLRRTAPSMLSPRAKMNNYLNMIVAGQPIKTARPNAWPLLLDENGNLAEGSGSNIFIVQDGGLRTPRARYVLPGVSRQMTMDLAAKLGIQCDEADIDLYDAAIRAHAADGLAFDLHQHDGAVLHRHRSFRKIEAGRDDADVAHGSFPLSSTLSKSARIHRPDWM